jgi:hypothetical protein
MLYVALGMVEPFSITAGRGLRGNCVIRVPLSYFYYDARET